MSIPGITSAELTEEVVWQKWLELRGQDRLCHVSSCEARDSIASKGLLVSKCKDVPDEHGAGIWLAGYPYFRPPSSDSDLWLVDVSGLEIIDADDFDDGEVYISVNDINAERLTLIDPAPGIVRGGWSQTPERNSQWIDAFQRLVSE